MGVVSTNVQGIRQRIASACGRCARDPKSVLLIAVSKLRAGREIRAAYGAGIRDFGENRVKEALGKREVFPKNCRLHMVGHLQSNKAREAIALFDVIHSVDSVELAQKISKCAKDAGKIQQILLEVNISGEPSKQGFSPNEVVGAAREISALSNAKLVGLMAMAPLHPNPETARLVFRKLRGLRDSIRQETGLELPHLSMGMTDDFEVAIEEGATMLRVGRAIFD